MCNILNGGCEDECRLDAAGEVSCHCFSGRTLMADGRRCSSKDAGCNDQEFQCSAGGCIPYHLTCDGTPTCEDDSDEDPHFCGMFVLWAFTDFFTLIKLKYVFITNTKE
jgi:integrin beta 2